MSRSTKNTKNDKEKATEAAQQEEQAQDEITGEDAQCAEEQEIAADEAAEEKTRSRAEEERDMYLDMLRRERADFENYKKRNALIAAESFANGCVDAVEKILPVLDNFERAFTGVEEDADDAFASGVRMIYRQLADAMAALGVKEIEAQGAAFDPNLMNAVMQVEATEEIPAGHVAEVLQKGYLLKEKVVRHAMVKVAG